MELIHCSSFCIPQNKAVLWQCLGLLLFMQQTKRIHPICQLILQFFHSSREANKVAFVLSSTGDRNTRIGQGLRLRSSFVRLFLPLLIAAVASHVLKPWLQLQGHSWASTASCCSACGFQTTYCSVQSSSQTALQFCIPCFSRDMTESSCLHKGSQEGKGN